MVDDIWKSEVWNIIRCSLVENTLGSRVITTTRIEEVAKACCLSFHDHVYRIEPLNVHDSRKLVHKRVVFVSEDASPGQLNKVPDNMKDRNGRPEGG